MNLPDEFQLLRDQIKLEDVQEMGLHIKVSDEGYYVDFELGAMSEAMKRQMFDQLTALVMTYKKLSSFISPDEKP